MNDSFIAEKFLGKWSLAVNTPFGAENYTLTINSEPLVSLNQKITGLITDGKNSITYTTGEIIENNFSCSMEMEFPIKATVLLNLNLVGHRDVAGFVQIDKYLKLEVIGLR